MTKRIRRLLAIDSCDDCAFMYMAAGSPVCSHPAPPVNSVRDIYGSSIPRWCPLPREGTGTATRPAGMRRRS